MLPLNSMNTEFSHSSNVGSFMKKETLHTPEWEYDAVKSQNQQKLAEIAANLERLFQSPIRLTAEEELEEKRLLPKLLPRAPSPKRLLAETIKSKEDQDLGFRRKDWSHQIDYDTESRRHDCNKIRRDKSRSNEERTREKNENPGRMCRNSISNEEYFRKRDRTESEERENYNYNHRENACFSDKSLEWKKMQQKERDRSDSWRDKSSDKFSTHFQDNSYQREEKRRKKDWSDDREYRNRDQVYNDPVHEERRKNEAKKTPSFKNESNPNYRFPFYMDPRIEEEWNEIENGKREGCVPKYPNKYYVVVVGRIPGIYLTWADAQVCLIVNH